MLKVEVLAYSLLINSAQFVDDDWLAANDLLPPTPPSTNPSSPNLPAQHRKAPNSISKDKSPFKDATIRTLRLKPITTVTATTLCSEAIETMRDKGFDQLPVLASSSKKRLVGLVTLGNLLSWISQGRATGSSPVEDVMFSFSKISEVVTDPRDISNIAPLSASGQENHDPGYKVDRSAMKTHGEADSRGVPQKRKFVEITLDTPLRLLSRFFEWNSAAVVTEKEEDWMKPVAVVTKVDLLGWLVKQGNLNGGEVTV